MIRAASSRAEARSATRSAALALCLALAGCSAGEDAAPSASGARPNLLLISIDSLRADHLGCYGYGRETSPRIDALAAEGALFEVTTSSTSWTLPSHCAMFTSLPDSVHGVTTHRYPLGEDRTTLAEALRDEGYATAGFWSGPYLHPRFGLAQGFDEYVDCTAYRPYSGEAGAPNEASELALDRSLPAQSHSDVTSPRILEKVGAWLRARDERPFFLFVHMWDVHYDYIPPPPFDRMFDPDHAGALQGRQLRRLAARKDGARLAQPDLEHLIALYDGEIAWVDQHVGALLDLLDELQLDERTAVVLTADHGEEFYEHGSFGHRKTLFEESVRVPLAVRYPGVVPRGRRVDDLASTLDIAPTLLELAGAPPLPDVLGRSLLDLLEPGEGARRQVVLAELERRPSLLAVRGAGWKLLLDAESGEELGLYALGTDPAERHDLSGGDSPLAAEARERGAQVRALLERLRALHGGRAEELGAMPPELEDALRDLGYIDEEG